MYVQILGQALEAWSDDLTGEELLELVVVRRAALPARDLGAGTWSAVTLATEVAYDCALINLAAEWGVDVSPRNFVHPRITRECLEGELAARGVDLRSPPRRYGESDGEKDGESRTT
jgi:hypothetical protein